MISVIVTNYNRQELLCACLQALMAQTYPPASMVVVDDGSRDGSADLVAREFPQVILIRNPDNRGHAAAVNIGIRATNTPFVATLNNDTIVQADWLEHLARALVSRPEVGMAASTMLFVKPSGMINSAGISIDRLGIAWDRHGGQCDAVDNTEITEVFGACAGAALYRRAMLNEIGLFDEDFFAYHEDVDLAWRAQLAGWKAVYVSAARVAHLHSATSIEGSPFKNRLLGRNKIWTIAKNYLSPYLWYYLPLIVLYDLLAVAFGIIQMRDLNVVRGRLDGLRGLPAMLRKRRQVRSLQRVPPFEVVRRMEPLVFPWTVLRRYTHIRAVHSQ